ncbi:MAG: hypothetical protein MJK13_18175 [Pseudomonadales bacterium]|nr:hypothetical protein [Pseudomonadales bacterium]
MGDLEQPKGIDKCAKMHSQIKTQLSSKLFELAIVSFYSIHRCALKSLSSGHAQPKSMRTSPGYRRKGGAAKIF